ncbi:MAG: hypothetical protein GX847_03320 [Clostridiales bacterium]|nr:hypothetical protein [Clostridiales bacterium]
MKKTLLLIVIVFCLSMIVPALAADMDYALLPDTGEKAADAPDGSGAAPEHAEASDRAAIGDILADWETNGYPDDIGGVFYDQETGKMTIFLVRSGIERENELRAVIPGIAFLPSAYSYNELLAVQEAITKEMMSQSAGETVIYSTGIGFTSIDGKVTGFGESGKEFRVVVSVDQSVYAETSNRLHQLYGDMVYVESGTAIVPAVDELINTSAPSGIKLPFLFALIALFLLAALVAASMLLRRRRGYAVQTANGETLTFLNRLTRKQTAEAVKDAAVQPGDAVYERIQKHL